MLSWEGVWEQPSETPKAKTGRSFLGPTGCGLCTAPPGGVLHLWFLSSWVRAPGSALTLGPLPLIGAFQWPLENHQAGMSVGN